MGTARAALILLLAPLILAGGRSSSAPVPATGAAVTLQNPILFVTQVPVPADCTTEF